MKLTLSCIGRLIVAVDVGAIADAKNVAVSLVEADAVILLRVAAFSALQPTVNDVGHQSISRCSPGATVGAGRTPFSRHHVVTGRLWRLRGHPEPDRRLKRDRRIASNNVWVVYGIESDFPASRSIVVVPVYYKSNLS